MPSLVRANAAALPRLSHLAEGHAWKRLETLLPRELHFLREAPCPALLLTCSPVPRGTLITVMQEFVAVTVATNVPLGSLDFTALLGVVAPSGSRRGHF